MRSAVNATNLETVSEGFGSWDKLKKKVFRTSEKEEEIKITPLTFKKLSEAADNSSLSSSVNFRTEVLSGLTNNAFVKDDGNEKDNLENPSTPGEERKS